MAVPDCGPEVTEVGCANLIRCGCGESETQAQRGMQRCQRCRRLWRKCLRVEERKEEGGEWLSKFHGLKTMLSCLQYQVMRARAHRIVRDFRRG